MELSRSQSSHSWGGHTPPAVPVSLDPLRHCQQRVLTPKKTLTLTPIDQRLCPGAKPSPTNHPTEPPTHGLHPPWPPSPPPYTSWCPSGDGAISLPLVGERSGGMGGKGSSLGKCCPPGPLGTQPGGASPKLHRCQQLLGGMVALRQNQPKRKQSPACRHYTAIVLIASKIQNK